MACARSSSSPPPASTRAGFLDLPGEIRNRIYSLIIPEQQFMLRCAPSERSSKSKSKASKSKDTQRAGRQHNRLYAIIPPVARYQKHLVFSAQLLRVCRTINEEAVPLLYASIALHFDTLAALNYFLNGAPAQGVSNVTKLAITQSGYGEPRWTTDTCWKVKHDQKWLSTCKRIAREMTGVKHLRLSLQICDWPSQLVPGAPWQRPLFFLRGKHGIDRVEVFLQSNRFPRSRLDMAARVIEDNMMSQEGIAQRQLRAALREIKRLEEKEKPQRTWSLLRVMEEANKFGCEEMGSRAIKNMPKATKSLSIIIQK